MPNGLKVPNSEPEPEPNIAIPLVTAMAQDLALSERDGWVLIPVRVQPRASHSVIRGVHDGALKVSLTAPPVEGEANSALVVFLAEKLGIPRNRVQLVRGATGRQKTVAVQGLSTERVHKALLALK